MWLDTGSIEGQSSKVEIYEPNQDDSRCLSTSALKTGTPFRYVQRIQIAITSEGCHIVLSVKDGSAGCRIVGDAFAQLASHFASINAMPERIFLSSTSGFHLRGLLTLCYLSNPLTRSVLWENYSWQHISSDKTETAHGYELRAVNVIDQNLVDYERLDPSTLCIPGVQSKPDGLFISRDSNELAIVEAKKHGVDFGAGTAQLIQYYAQAMKHPDFQNMVVKMYHVTSQPTQTTGYKVWQDLMRSAKTFRFLVQAA